MRHSVLLAALLTLATSASADTVRVDGATYDGVFVQATSKQYLILFPEEGTVLSVAKSALSAGDVQRTEDPGARKALRTAWQEKSRALRSNRSAELDESPESKDLSEEPRAAFRTLYLPRQNEHLRQAESFINEHGVRTLILKGVPLDPEVRRAREEQRREARLAWDEEVRYRQQIAREQLAARQQAERYAAQAAYEQQQWALSLQRQQLNNEYQRLRNANLRQRYYSPWYPTVYTRRFGPYGNSFMSIGSNHMSISSGRGIHTTVVHRAGRAQRHRRPHVAPRAASITREGRTARVSRVVSPLTS